MTTFGVPLGDHLLQVGAEIPPLVCRCVLEIDKRGINIKGLYRVSGVKSRVEKLCQAFENGADLVDLSDVHPNVIASVVKLYMRQLPEPLCTFRLYSDFIREGRRCPALESGQVKPHDWDRLEHEATENLRRLCQLLPHYHLKTLGFLCHHLHRISLQSEVNNMPASNLAIGEYAFLSSYSTVYMNYIPPLKLEKKKFKKRKGEDGKQKNRNYRKKEEKEKGGNE